MDRALAGILEAGGAPVLPPIRSEIFGLQRFAQHGRSLGQTHRAAPSSARTATFFPRLRSNIQMLRAAHHYIGVQASTGYDISPAAEWLLDNFHLIETQLEEIRAGLPRSYFRTLPLLVAEPLAGLPRVYGVAWAFVAHTDGAFDEDLLQQFLLAYQETRELSLSEMWALPTTLRVVLVENLRRLAERVAMHKAARELANLCCDRLQSCSIDQLDTLHTMLLERGVGAAFLVQMAQRLRSRRAGDSAAEADRYDLWLRQALPDPAAMLAQQGADQTADNLSVSNAITSLRAIGDADWPDVIARTSTLMRLMLTSPLFEAEHTTTRDQTLHGIERLARHGERSEVEVAQALLSLMATGGGDSVMSVASHWLRGSGRPALLRSLGLDEWVAAGAVQAWRTIAHRSALPVYLGVLLLGSLGLVAWMLRPAGWEAAAHSAPWLTLTVALLMLFPASEAVVAVVNRLISESARPSHLPRLALARGVPREHRVLVVVPAMLGRAGASAALAHRLELHHLANPETHAQFALLTDWADADAMREDGDAASLAEVVAQIDALNARYPDPPDPALPRLPDGAAPPRFIVLHRERSFSQSEQRWIGWERKRGKIEQLIAALAEGHARPFIDLGRSSRIAADTRHVLTLDSDTQLPPGRLRELVGVAAHPHNQPRLDASGRCVVTGYGILQPRVATPLPALREFTLYHWLFAGQCGIDPYSAASSEVYQDLFHEGSFTGKGLLNVHAMHAVLAGRLPEDRVLSHDLIEGSMVRCAAVTDITVLEDAPFHADVAASRVHRWTRGDWQLLPFLFRPRLYPLRAIHRWKMFDNLRRSLVAPASLALLLLALGTAVVSPWSALALVAAAFTAGPLMGAVAGFSPSRDDLAKRHFYRRAVVDLWRVVCGGAWHLAQLLHHALQALDAVLRALYRMRVSRRHLLQWTTAAAAQAQAATSLAALLREHRRSSLVAIGLCAALLATGSAWPWLTAALCALWAASPLWTWWVSRASAPVAVELGEADQAALQAVARDTWRFFERCVGAADHHLPPDNLQTLPLEALAHRTSPTNIGLYLLSVACARQFGWIGTEDLLDRLQATLATLATLQRHRGHFLNWYDTQTCAPLLPMYVSTVDSGNLSGHLLALAQACRELARAPHDDGAARRALAASQQRIASVRAHHPRLCADGSAWARLLDVTDPLAAAVRDVASFENLLRDADDELAQLVAPPEDGGAYSDPTPRDRLGWLLADHLATLRSALRDLQAAQAARVAQAAPAGQPCVHAAQALLAVADRCEAIAWEAEFGFLYHRKRRLFRIGYRVAEQQLDAGFYDLLASEARLTSLLAVAKGDVPVSHWCSLGRMFFAVGAVAGLRSWSGSMFEYLMPTLVLAEPHGSVLRDAGHAAVHEQVEYALAHGVPWGISESAYAGRDHTLAYQYAPQGVPRLALRRTPPDELVVAPYATVLAAQLEPQRAARNLDVLARLGARSRYGFIEALDFSAARLAGGQVFAPVATFMAHHQGMIIVALANVLQGGVAQRWGMANAHVEAVASLLHERAPREVSQPYVEPAGPQQQGLQRRGPALLREVLPGTSALEPTHVLSNGRYHVTLRANGAGSSRRGTAGIGRWRDDALRDAHGSFFYLRRLAGGDPGAAQPAVSLTQHPAPDPDAHYHSTFHADRVCFGADWPELRSQVTVWVSPEDDIEFRQVELHNASDHAVSVELLSAFDITLADARADEAHPAFSNLFVRAHWQAQHQALVFERRPRLATEQGLLAAHFLADHDPQVVAVRLQTDRQRWLGRNRSAAAPLAAFDALPGPVERDAGAAPAPEPGLLDSGLDPVCALAVQWLLAPQSSARLTFATAASDHPATLHAVIDKYRQPSHVQRASLMSATLAGIRLRGQRIGAENFAAIQSLTTALLLTLTRPDAAAPHAEDDVDAADAVCDRRALWRYGLSGERPIILVSVGLMQGLGLLRSLTQALRLWSWGGVACDLVVVNAEPASYQMALQREIAALRERHAADSGARVDGGPAVDGAVEGAAAAHGADAGRTRLHLLRADELSGAELGTLRRLARLHLHADGRPLVHHVQEWVARHELDYEQRQGLSCVALTTAMAPSAAVLGAAPSAAVPGGAASAAVPVSKGRFDALTGEFRFEVGAAHRPQRPWINVLSNPFFGAQLTEAGGGYTWARNSRLNQLSAWSNDPVADPPAECFLLQDLRTLQVWSVTPSAWGDPQATYQVAHGQGYSVIAHLHGELQVSATWCVDAHSSVKQVRLRLVNHGTRSMPLRLVGIVEWVMGASRADRATVHTALHRQRLPAQKLSALLCTQLEHAAGFGGGTAFLALASGITGTDQAGAAGRHEEAEDWTCDRRECFDARGQPVLPDHFGQRGGSGLDPCAALSTRLTLGAGEAQERVFLLGYADTPHAARQLAALAAVVPANQRAAQVRDAWNTLLGATQVKTPDPLFDALVNRWLLYQAVACRLWAKAGFYQAGGATGFRDQLQDAMALGWAAPAMLREQIVLCASRQFVEGDVQHWWHAPGGAGVRTHFSDDLLWLPHALAHYLSVTGDTTLLDDKVPFLEAEAIPEGAEDAYTTPAVASETASVYEHGARAIDRSLRVGEHGLPLMGSGDWNDGMNRVGHLGRGESVWLGWFLCRLVADFAPLARARGDMRRVLRWESAAQGWRSALNGAGWDGQWFKRAFFDDGSPLGSHVNAEARIDLIAQAWAVLSGVAEPALQRIAMASVEEHLVDHQAGLLRLLDPPLAQAVPSAGYIQAYPPGVRENGGQYAHAGVWALMAQVEQARRQDGPADGDLAYRSFCSLSPAHRAHDLVRGAAYRVEPYVMAGDVYTHAPYVGRGGWSWYTGAAAWMHRAAVESMFGLALRAGTLSFTPCLPSHWQACELTLRRDGRTLRFILVRAAPAQAIEAAAPSLGPDTAARLLLRGQSLDWTALPPYNCFVVPLLDAA